MSKPNQNNRVFLIDDDLSFHRQLKFEMQDFEIDGVASEARIFTRLYEDRNFDLILLDLVLDPESNDRVGLELLPKILNAFPKIPIIVVTNDKKSRQEALRGGASDYLQKSDYDPESWAHRFATIIENRELKRRNEIDDPPESPFIGVSPQIKQIKKTLKTLADDSELTVLITGETGVGKGVAARFLHYNSSLRNMQPFEEIHISNIAPDLIPSELFGAKKGSFTGAVDDIKGRLHSADKGIVFLDEIGDLDLQNQVRLLQFLQNKTIRPIGTLKDIKLDVQIVAATNKNLREEVASGNFRADLYQRLKVFPIEIPPLRERREDIMPLMVYFFKLSESEVLNIIDAPVVNTLVNAYNWEGNTRELENAVKRMRTMQRVLELTKITAECLPEEIQGIMNRRFVPVAPQEKTESFVPKPSDMTLEQLTAWNTLEAYEKALTENMGIKSRMAETLNTKPDLILYRLKTICSDFPGFIDCFPMIKKYYKTIGK